ncbi:FAD-dependent oxidoreductase [bacterium]|nr:FAD-dependent oxidoreductase [bacterium]
MTQISVDNGFYRAGNFTPDTALGTDWVYDMIVIGGGTGGLVAAGFAGRLGLKVALIEKEHLGGDCTWFGCVPSKALLKVAKVAHTIRTADRYGLEASVPRVEMARVRDHVQQIVAETYSHETPAAFSMKYGVDVFTGQGRFTEPHTVSVNGRLLKGKRFIIATGARPTVPSVAGLADVPYDTYRTIFTRDELPEHLLIIGAGPIGVEMAQAHARLGAQVTLVDAALLPRGEPEVHEVMLRVFEREGIRYVQELAVSVAQEAGIIHLALQNGEVVTGDALLVAAGRVPNVDTLDLDKAGVTHSTKGIQVDKYLRTGVRHHLRRW